MEQTQTAASDRLSGRGFLSAVSPCLGAFIQMLVLTFVFRGIPPARVLAYLAVIGAWAFFSGIFVAICLPELANQLAASRAFARPRERYLTAGCLLLYLLVLPATAALELLSWRGAAFADYAFLVGLALYALGFFLLHWAMLHNRQWSIPIASSPLNSAPIVESGPYRFIRHPGYLALALCSVATALMLGSAMSLFPALALVLLLVYRTGEEDDYLRQNRESYPAYAAKVKYRFLPGLW